MEALRELITGIDAAARLLPEESENRRCPARAAKFEVAALMGRLARIDWEADNIDGQDGSHGDEN
ncbi:MAG: hypothetical protein M3548_22865 [Actinomycetota bacterium]|nr:hypothetical protein [Actinomycetota bacterium]